MRVGKHVRELEIRAQYKAFQDAVDVIIDAGWAKIEDWDLDMPADIYRAIILIT